MNWRLLFRPFSGLFCRHEWAHGRHPVTLERRGGPVMRLTYDREADAAYLYLKKLVPGEVKRTVGALPPMDDVTLDLNAEGQVVGVEFLDPARQLPVELLEQAE